jgi:hypothetical protein
MQIISLSPIKMTPELLSGLEKRGLVRTLRPTKKIIATRAKTGAVDTFYASEPENGTHKLLCIGKRSTQIKLSYHTDNEEFILVNTTRYHFKPLYLIIGLHKSKVMEQKFRDMTITAADFMAIELEYNNPFTCFFTLLKHTVHCEVTTSGNGMHPIFFVTEPSKLKMNYIVSRAVNLSVEV